MDVAHETPLDVRPTDRDRLPPGQHRTEKWPVLHYGRPAEADAAEWSVFVRGAVGRPLELGWEELMELPRHDVLCDIHCVTGWSRFDVRFTGVPAAELVSLASPVEGASHVLVHATDGWTANLRTGDLLRDGVLLAHAHAGRPLAREHGGPLRLVVPHLYFWKSAKWLVGFEFGREERPGFWERNGYHMRGDPWREERFAW